MYIHTHIALKQMQIAPALSGQLFVKQSTVGGAGAGQDSERRFPHPLLCTFPLIKLPLCCAVSIRGWDWQNSKFYISTVGQRELDLHPLLSRMPQHLLRPVEKGWFMLPFTEGLDTGKWKIVGKPKITPKITPSAPWVTADARSLPMPTA